MNNSNNLIVVGKNSNISVKNFDSLDEFQQYYNLHKEEIEKLSTVKLNRMFKIKDYKITRRTLGEQGVGDNEEEGKTLCFRQLFKNELPETHNTTEVYPDYSTQIEDLNARIKQLELENVKIKNQILEIINALNA